MRFTGTLWVFGGHSKFFPRGRSFQTPWRVSENPSSIIWTYVLSVKYLASSSWMSELANIFPLVAMLRQHTAEPATAEVA